MTMLSPNISQLSPRQIEILTLLANDTTHAQICVQLGLSQRTVSEHIRRAKIKLGTQTREGAVAYVVATGAVCVRARTTD